MAMGKGVGAVVVVVVCCAAALGMAVRAEAQMEAVSAASDSLRGFTIELPFQLDARGCVTNGDGADGFLAPEIQLRGARASGAGEGDGDAVTVEVAEKFSIECVRGKKTNTSSEPRRAGTRRRARSKGSHGAARAVLLRPPT